jgi:hypothetical protein
MDITQSLKDTENALRDFIMLILQESFGQDWESKSGVTEERLEMWRERKMIEEKRQESGVVDERLLYYADFYDLKTILQKHWSGSFSEALGDWKTMEVFLTELEKLRDPDAHRRELLPHQKSLAVGIAGEIRTRITRFRSKRETNEDFFPRIESVRDNLGNIWTPTYSRSMNTTGAILHPGDYISYVITANDSQGNKLLYGISMPNCEEVLQEDNTLSYTVEYKHIGKDKIVELFIRTLLDYHAYNGSLVCDDEISLIYDILPLRSSLA